MTDLELTQKCLDGNLKYFGELYERYVDKIYRFVYGKTNNNEVAEDIVSDVFLSALNKISNFKIDENASISAWFYKIAYNKVIDYYKTNSETEDIENCFDLGVESDLNKIIDDKDKLKKVFAYVNGMKKEHRDVFLYRIWEDLSYKEIAEITDINEANCKQIMSRTLKNITANFVLILVVLVGFDTNVILELAKQEPRIINISLYN